jgi:repressor LexA
LNQELSDRQARILDYIRNVTRERNYPPSVREIGEAVGLSSSSTVHNHLLQLERRGLIRRDPSKSRTVQLVEDAASEDHRPRAVPVPVVGSVKGLIRNY